VLCAAKRLTEKIGKIKGGEKTNHIRRFLHSTTAKTNYGLVLVAVIIVAVGVMGLDRGWFGNIQLPFSISGNSGSSSGVNVNREVMFTLSDKYAGNVLTSKTLVVYNSLLEQVESLTTGSDGTAHTAHPYQSGTQLYVKYVSSNTKQWFPVTVPTMLSSEQQVSQYNPVALDAFTIGTGGISLRAGGVAVTDSYTDGDPGTTDTPTFTLELYNNGADNTGMIESTNPILNQAWDLYLVVTISGKGYENIVYSGFDQQYTLGTTYYGASHLSADGFTKWKTGSTYETGYAGDQTASWSLDLSGASGNTATMNVYVYAYCDPTYAQTHGGNLGNDKYQLATLSVDLSYGD
jgi:hypothetical protein